MFLCVYHVTAAIAPADQGEKLYPQLLLEARADLGLQRLFEARHEQPGVITVNTPCGNTLTTFSGERGASPGRGFKRASVGLLSPGSHSRYLNQQKSPQHHSMPFTLPETPSTALPQPKEPQASTHQTKNAVKRRCSQADLAASGPSGCSVVGAFGPSSGASTGTSRSALHGRCL